jgi:protein-disulfide isomerase
MLASSRPPIIPSSRLSPRGIISPVEDASSPIVPKRKHRLLKRLLLVFVIILIPPLVWFLAQFVYYFREIKSGRGMSVADRKISGAISQTIKQTNVTDADRLRLLPTGNAPELGSKNAKVTIVEFVDYQCPYTKDSSGSIKQVVTSLKDRVRFLIRDFPITELHETAKQSALAASCVLEQGQDIYWKFYDLLFQSQDHQSADDLRGMAQLAGVKVLDYDACTKEARYVKKIEQDIQDGIHFGIQGTPVFFVNGYPFQGALDEKTITRILSVMFDQMPK